MRTVGLLALAVLLAACAGPSAFHRGLVHLRAGQYAEARQAFDEAIFEAPDSPAAHPNPDRPPPPPPPGRPPLGPPPLHPRPPPLGGGGRRGGPGRLAPGDRDRA